MANAVAETDAAIPPRLVEAFRACPGFTEAMRLSASGIVAAHDRNRLLNRLISDRGRAIFGILAMYLHFHADATGGLTPSRMTQLCEETRLCSRGRAKALLVLLRWAGYLAPLRGGGDLRRRPLAPTERMLKSYLGRWRQQLETIAPLSPDAAEIATRIEQPDILGRFAVEIGKAFRAGFRLLDYAPALRPIAERDNGILLVLTMALSGPEDGPVPPAAPVALSVTELAARARVSRSHALHLLREAEDQGLVARVRQGEDGAGRSHLAFPPFLAESLEGFFAASFTVLAVCASRVINGLEARPAPADARPAPPRDGAHPSP